MPALHHNEKGTGKLANSAPRSQGPHSKAPSSILAHFNAEAKQERYLKIKIAPHFPYHVYLHQTSYYGLYG